MGRLVTDVDLTTRGIELFPGGEVMVVYETYLRYPDRKSAVRFVKDVEEKLKKKYGDGICEVTESPNGVKMMCYVPTESSGIKLALDEAKPYWDYIDSLVRDVKRTF